MGGNDEGDAANASLHHALILIPLSLSLAVNPQCTTAPAEPKGKGRKLKREESKKSGRKRCPYRYIGKVERK